MAGRACWWLQREVDPGVQGSADGAEAAPMGPADLGAYHLRRRSPDGGVQGSRHSSSQGARGSMGGSLRRDSALSGQPRALSSPA